MGYKNNSPVKQVWLPLEYGFLQEYADNKSFSYFSEIYKERYGIDLHDVFEFHKDGDDVISVGVKAGLVGTYNIGLLGENIKTEYALTNGLINITSTSQGQEVIPLLTIYVGDTDTLAQGFTINLPALSSEVKSIDDLLITTFVV